MNHALLAYNSRDRWGPDTVNRCHSLTVETLRDLPTLLSLPAFYHDRLDFRSRKQRPGQQQSPSIDRSIDRSTFVSLQASVRYSGYTIDRRVVTLRNDRFGGIRSDLEHFGGAKVVGRDSRKRGRICRRFWVTFTVRPTVGG